MKIEFEEAASLLEADRDATTITIDDEDTKAEKQRIAAGFIPDGDDEDRLASDDKTEVWTTKTHDTLNVVALKKSFGSFGFSPFLSFSPHLKLLSGQKKSAPFWTFEYYQQFFDIETHHVIFLYLILILKQCENFSCNMFVRVLNSFLSGEGENHWLNGAVAQKELHSCLPSKKSWSLWSAFTHLPLVLIRGLLVNGRILSSCCLLRLSFVIFVMNVVFRNQTYFQTWIPLFDICALRTILDLYDSCVCHCHQWQHIHLSGQVRQTKL